jgi:hypothetical protein
MVIPRVLVYTNQGEVKVRVSKSGRIVIDVVFKMIFNHLMAAGGFGSNSPTQVEGHPVP